MPSRASGVARKLPMHCAVYSMTLSSIARSATSRTRSLATPCASGPALQQRVHEGVDAFVERLGRRHLVHHPDPVRLVRIEAFGGEEIAAGHAVADGPDDVRADRSGHDAELDFGGGKRRAGRGDRDVAGGGEARAAAERRAVNARERRLAHAIDGLSIAASARASRMFSSAV